MHGLRWEVIKEKMLFLFMYPDSKGSLYMRQTIKRNYSCSVIMQTQWEVIMLMRAGSIESSVHEMA